MIGRYILIILVVLLAVRVIVRLRRRTANSKKTSLKPLKSWQRKLYPVYKFGQIAIRRAFRDKTAVFFLFLFPLIFLFVFGGIFGRNKNVSFKVALLNQSRTVIAKQTAEQISKNPLFKVDANVTSLNQAKEKMSRSQIDATILLPSDFGAVNGGHPAGQAQVIYTQNNQQAGQALAPSLQAGFQDLNSRYISGTNPFSVKTEALSTKGLSQFDYTFSGLLGFSIIGLGIFGPVNVFPELKKQGVLRRLHTTPLRVWQYFLANMVSQSILGLVSLGIMFAVALSIFNLKVSGNPLELIIYLVLSIITILGIGLAIGGWARNVQQAAPLSNIVVFPMLFLSGTFFPRYIMPEFLQKITTFLPLTPVIDGIRLIAAEGKSIFALGPQLAVLGVWLVVIYAIAFSVFRWE